MLVSPVFGSRANRRWSRHWRHISRQETGTKYNEEKENVENDKEENIENKKDNSENDKRVKN